VNFLAKIDTYHQHSVTTMNIIYAIPTVVFIMAFIIYNSYL